MSEVLGNIFAIFILCFPYYMWYKLSQKQKKYNEITTYFASRDKNIPDYVLAHNNSILTESEKRFFYILAKFCKEYKLFIFSQVALLSIAQVNGNRNKQVYDYLFSNIYGKYVDFVIVDKNFNIKFVIELDDNSHYKYKRKQRDMFIDDVFQEINIPLKHIKTTDDYFSKIQEILIELGISK